MLLVVDTNVLVSECLRTRGRQRLRDAGLELLVTERVDGEFQYEFRRRLDVLAARAGLTFVFVASQDQYAPLEPHARLRIPGDADDWPTVALALNAEVWTEDRDFFGCGLSVWRTDVLYAHLDEGGEE